MPKPKKALAASAFTDEEFEAMPQFEPENLHFEFTSTSDGEATAHVVERGAPAHGGGVTVDGRTAESVRHDGTTIIVKWKGGGLEEFPSAKITKTFPAN